MSPTPPSWSSSTPSASASPSFHQLRGRVGRGDKPSVCLLLYKTPLGEVARERLSIMRETEDGFRIAEEDLRLRGGGEILGTRQSGMPGFRIASARCTTPT